MDINDPAMWWWNRQEDAKRKRRRDRLLTDRPELFADLDLVEIVPHPTSSAALHLRVKIKPGSVLVAHSYAEGLCHVDYEGGLYSRNERAPTTSERDEYARIAAGRAAVRAPTVARAYAIPRVDLRTIGRINIGEQALDWFPNRLGDAS